MQRFILFLDLKDDPELIKEYEKYHESIPVEIEESILSSGIESMHIFRFENRLCMEIISNDEFSFYTDMICQMKDGFDGQTSESSSLTTVMNGLDKTKKIFNSN